MVFPAAPCPVYATRVTLRELGRRARFLGSQQAISSGSVEKDLLQFSRQAARPRQAGRRGQRAAPR